MDLLLTMQSPTYLSSSLLKLSPLRLRLVQFSLMAILTFTLTMVSGDMDSHSPSHSPELPLLPLRLRLPPWRLPKGRSERPMLRLILLSLQATPPILTLPSPIISHTQPPMVFTLDIPMLSRSPLRLRPRLLRLKGNKKNQILSSYISKKLNQKCVVILKTM